MLLESSCSSTKDHDQEEQAFQVYGRKGMSTRRTKIDHTILLWTKANIGLCPQLGYWLDAVAMHLSFLAICFPFLCHWNPELHVFQNFFGCLICSLLLLLLVTPQESQVKFRVVMAMELTAPSNIQQSKWREKDTCFFRLLWMGISTTLGAHLFLFLNSLILHSKLSSLLLPGFLSCCHGLMGLV